MATPSSSSTTKSHDVYLGLGTNLGQLSHNLHHAIRLIERHVGHVVRHSSFYESLPMGFQSPHHFLNAVVHVSTPLSPRQLLTATQLIERRMGRTEKSVDHVYHDRIIDIDILYYDQLHIAEPDLVIPHPQIKKRPFVLEPLRELGVVPTCADQVP